LIYLCRTTLNDVLATNEIIMSIPILYHLSNLLNKYQGWSFKEIQRGYYLLALAFRTQM